MYMCARMCVCGGGEHFFVEAYLIKYYRQPLSTYSYFDPFKSLYVSYNVRLELANKFSVFNWFPSTFGPL